MGLPVLVPMVHYTWVRSVMAVSVLAPWSLHIGKICNGCVCVGSMVHYT